MSLDRELARYAHEAASIEAALDEAIKLAARTLKALRNEEAQAVTDAGATGRRVDLDYTRRVREVTSALEAATRAKVSLDKTAAVRAKQMSQEQRLAAFEAAVAGLPIPDRRRFLMRCVATHNSAVAEAVALGLTPAPESKTFVDVA